MKTSLIAKAAILSLSLVSAAHASTTITFSPATAGNDDSIPSGYGGDANVTVSYSAQTDNLSNGYGTLGGGTGDGAFSYLQGALFTMTLTAAPGYTVTLDSFDLAAYGGENTGFNDQSTDITVTGGATTYTNDGSFPSGSTFSTYSPDETGTSLTLNVTQLFELGINDITYSETGGPVSATPEPTSLIYGLTGVSSLVAAGLRRRRASR